MKYIEIATGCVRIDLIMSVMRVGEIVKISLNTVNTECGLMEARCSSIEEAEKLTQHIIRTIKQEG